MAILFFLCYLSLIVNAVFPCCIVFCHPCVLYEEEGLPSSPNRGMEHCCILLFNAKYINDLPSYFCSSLQQVFLFGPWQILFGLPQARSVFCQSTFSSYINTHIVVRLRARSHYPSMNQTWARLPFVHMSSRRNTTHAWPTYVIMKPLFSRCHKSTQWIHREHGDDFCYFLAHVKSFRSDTAL